MIAADNFHEYCFENGIKNPYHELVSERTEDWRERAKKFENFMFTFYLWDYHFYMPWEEFSQRLQWAKDYTDTSIYMPCDAAERQCNMACAYFGGKCPRQEGELKSPIKGLEGRYEPKPARYY